MSVEILPTGSRVTLSTGEIVLGEPHDTDAYRATARRLGYSDDTLAMAQDHDPLHARLCSWLGLGDSLSLRCAAGVRNEDDASLAEEDAVLAVQRFARLAGVRLSSCEAHPRTWPTKS